MRRLFQFGAIVMLIGAIYPLFELFDCWDPPGLSDDTELAVHAFLVVVCLVLLLSRLIALVALKLGFVSWRISLHNERLRPVEAGHTLLFIIPPLFALPLRI